jgi:hypothetical protein
VKPSGPSYQEESIRVFVLLSVVMMVKAICVWRLFFFFFFFFLSPSLSSVVVVGSLVSLARSLSALASEMKAIREDTSILRHRS